MEKHIEYLERAFACIENAQELLLKKQRSDYEHRFVFTDGPQIKEQIQTQISNLRNNDNGK
jgi:hypothetical protein